MKIWICVEKWKPLTWAIRYGNKWRLVRHFVSKIPLKSKQGKIAPHAYLEGEGRVHFAENRATILALGGIPSGCDYRPRAKRGEK